MRDKPFYDSALFWVALGGVVVTIGGILWSHGGLIAVVVGSLMLLWSLVLFLAHNHAERHIQGYLAQRQHSFEERSEVSRQMQPAPRSVTQAVAKAGPKAPIVLDREQCKLSPKELVRLFRQGGTEFQGQGLVKPYIGQWREVVGAVIQISQANDVVLAVVCTDPDGVRLDLFFDPSAWAERLQGVMAGDQIRAFGRVRSVQKGQVIFGDCELVE